MLDARRMDAKILVLHPHDIRRYSMIHSPQHRDWKQWKHGWTSALLRLQCKQPRSHKRNNCCMCMLMVKCKNLNVQQSMS